MKTLYTLFTALTDVLKPGTPKFKAQLNFLTDEQKRLITTLHLLEDPATRGITAATDSAAEF